MTEPGENREVDTVEAAQQIKHSLTWLMRATILLYIFMVGAGFYIYINANNNRDALCAIRSEFQRRVDSSEKFLQDHPKGVPGNSATSVLETISSEKSTIKALKGINCPAPPI